MRSASSPRAVSMITGSSDVDRIQRQSSSPSVPGSITSSTTRSGRRSSEHVACGFAVTCLERAVPLALEIADDDLAHDGLIVDDEHGLHRLSVPPLPGCNHLDPNDEPAVDVVAEHSVRWIVVVRVQRQATEGDLQPAVGALDHTELALHAAHRR